MSISNDNSLRSYGCPAADVLKLNATVCRHGHRPASVHYLGQRSRAALRGIEWRITFPEWLTIWRESGKWEERGSGGDCYCMARYGDTGPYAPGNVFIQTVRENSRDGSMKFYAQKRALRELVAPELIAAPPVPATAQAA